MARHFYAIKHRYGSHVQDRAGRSIGTIFHFTTLDGRQRWICAGPGYSTENGYREAMSATSREVRSVLRSKGRRRPPAGPGQWWIGDLAHVEAADEFIQTY